MKARVFILFLTAFLSLTISVSKGKTTSRNIQFDFFGDSISLVSEQAELVDFTGQLSVESVKAFYKDANSGNYQQIIDTLLLYKEKYQLNDWVYYQLIRKTVQQISPKSENYERYTLYKWFLLAKSGYDATLAVGNNKILLYVRSDENVYDIPYYEQDGRQYVCLNYHDYGKIDFEKEQMQTLNLNESDFTTAFSYKVTQLPDFHPADYSEKNIKFKYGNKSYHFKVMLTPQVQNIFVNYPVVDYESYFNIPLSKKTYGSLIPLLKDAVAKMDQNKGVDYLMKFTRNAFLYENDQQNFGKEKRLSPEQTLLFDYSDCDDRAGLFFYLVKEVYDLPMIVLLYPTHVTIAVGFDNPEGNTIVYKDNKYSVCEPTPQARDLSIGQISPDLENAPFQVAYEYIPRKK